MLAVILGALVGIPTAVANADLAVADAPIEAVVTTDPNQPAEPVASADEPPPAPTAPTEPEPAPEEPVAAAPPSAPPIAPDAPAEAPVDPIVATVEPPPAPAAAVAEPPPPPPSAPHETTIRTPPAPQEPTAADDKEPAGGAVTLSIVTPTPSLGAQPAEPTALGTKSTAPVAADGTPASFKQQPVSPPLVAPLVHRLLPTAVPFADGNPYLGHGTMAAVPATQIEHASPVNTAKASHVQSELVFAGYVPGGGSGQSAGLLAMLMGLLPLGVPDGKFSMSAETQLGLLLLGALIVVIPFFAAPIRDRRRRGPRGFATLALRPG